MHEQKRKAKGIYEEYAQANYQFQLSLLSPSSFALVAVSSRKREESLSSDNNTE